jgi:hypothetical protein
VRQQPALRLEGAVQSSSIPKMPAAVAAGARRNRVFLETNSGLFNCLPLGSTKEIPMSKENQNPGQQSQNPGQQNQKPGQKPGQQQQGGGQKPGQQQQDPNRQGQNRDQQGKGGR